MRVSAQDDWRATLFQPRSTFWPGSLRSTWILTWIIEIHFSLIRWWEVLSLSSQTPWCQTHWGLWCGNLCQPLPRQFSTSLLPRERLSKTCSSSAECRAEILLYILSLSKTEKYSWTKHCQLSLLLRETRSSSALLCCIDSSLGQKNKILEFFSAIAGHGQGG